MSTIVITGCSSGFGYQAAQEFARRGDRVYATMRAPEGKNASAAAELRAFADQHQCQLEVIDLDVTSDSSIAAAAAHISAAGHTPDVLINNAGQMFVGLAEAFTADELSRQLDVNVVGIHRVNRAFLPSMRARKSGLIINVSSTAGRIGAPFFAIYHASKWGIEGYSLGLRRELACTGVDVVVVEPGPFSTELFPQSPHPEDTERRSESYPQVAHETFDGMNAAFEGMFEDPDVPTDPIAVVNRYVELADMAPGTRPFRSVVGVDLGVAARNDSDEAHDPDFLEAMGIAEFSKLRVD